MHNVIQTAEMMSKRPSVHFADFDYVEVISALFAARQNPKVNNVGVGEMWLRFCR